MIIRKGTIEEKEMISGVYRKNLGISKSMMMCEIRLEKGSEVPLHSHPHEQVGYVISGCIEMAIDGEVIKLYPGDSYAIASNIHHSGKAIEDTIVLDIFSPHREDYL